MPILKRKNLSEMMPDAWPIFFKQRRPRLIQEKSMPFLVRGGSALLSGPTASGKTEAVVAPLFQRHISFQRKNLSVIYVAPTKALINDLYYRIDGYLAARMPGLVRRYTGDHHDFTLPDDIFLLLATPEALDSLQLIRPHSLESVRAIVIDEIHLLHGNARGQQLRHVINRIVQKSVKPKQPKDVFQKIGMTATLQNMEKVKEIWLEDSAEIFKAEGTREIDMEFLPLTDSEFLDKPTASANALSCWFESSGTPKALIFGNTRNSTQILAANLNEKLKNSRWPIYWHTGILTATERERVEDAMKNDRFGICVATSTLEVGIDIGDIDVIVLADPPFSISAFLQRIGRGNRKTDICKVLALYSTEEERILFQALYNCAVSGEMDDIHDYDRASVRFQQALSFAWRGVRRDKKPLTMDNLVERTGDIEHAPIVNDMLSTGALEDIRGALIPSDELMDQGDKRQIHTTISSAGTLSIIDSTTGETLLSTSGQKVTEGSLYVGGKLKQVVENIDGTFTLEPVKKDKRPLSRLPATKGRGGLSRRMVWSLAELSGHNPRIWQCIGNKIITWGGTEYNLLLSLLFKQVGIANKIKSDEYGITGITDNKSITLAKVIEWATEIMESQILPDKVAAQFCDRSRYFYYLSTEMQHQEAQGSVPFLGLIHWCRECINVVKEDMSIKSLD